MRALTRLINVAEFPCTRNIIGGEIFGRLLVEIGKLDRDLKIEFDDRTLVVDI